MIPNNARALTDLERHVSFGAVWSVGGSVAAPSGTRYTTTFPPRRPKSEEQQDKHEGRLANALDIDRIQRVLVDNDGYSTFPRCRGKQKRRPSASKTAWTGTEWSNDTPPPVKLQTNERVLPNAPFKVLDAPGLRDDFYCSIMAYSPTCNTLAVGLGNLLYGWSEHTGVSLLNPGVKDGSWLTSVAFSSSQGQKSILAFGRSNGALSLLSLFDSMLPRFDAQHASPVACLSWRPVTTTRPSMNPFNPGVSVQAEDLLVGEEAGDVYYYSVEWPES